MKIDLTVHKILDRFKITVPVSRVDRKRIYRSKKRTFARLLKNERSNSILVGPAVWLYFLCNRLGINVRVGTGVRFLHYVLSSAVIFLIFSSAVLGLGSQGYFMPDRHAPVKLDIPPPPVVSENQPMTLDSIRKKYGTIDEVLLYSGRTYQGAVISKGDELTMCTVSGVKKIPIREVKSIMYIK
jgi:hypothetical protein